MQTSFPKAVLPESIQLEIANRIQADGDRATAAVAYERFLERYPDSRQAPEVQLLLSVLLVRFLARAEDAAPLLKQSLPKLTSRSHQALAKKLLDEVDAKRPTT